MEFDLIASHFATGFPTRADVQLGVGDDGALCTVPNGMQLVTVVDTLIAGVHFPLNTDPAAIAHKALAVNLSDIAAMAATPAWMTLALTLPEADETWLSAFSRGLRKLAKQYNVALIGGDTTHGPLSITIQVQGFIPQGKAIRRSGAQAGELIYVTGSLGDAGFALLALQGQVHLSQHALSPARRQLDWPEPRIEIGRRLSGIASSMIDISDGLAADLRHILEASGVGADIYAERLPISEVLRSHLDAVGGWNLPLTAGDDYELLFTVPESKQEKLADALANGDVPISWIGQTRGLPGLTCLLDDGQDITPGDGGYLHF